MTPQWISTCWVGVQVGTVEEYLEKGPGFIFLFHPALGPMWDVVAQKIRGGALMHGSELVLEACHMAPSNPACTHVLHFQGICRAAAVRRALRSSWQWHAQSFGRHSGTGQYASAWKFEDTTHRHYAGLCVVSSAMLGCTAAAMIAQVDMSCWCMDTLSWTPWRLCDITEQPLTVVLSVSCRWRRLR